MTKITRWIIERSGLVSGFAALSMAVSGYFGALLFLNLRPDLEDLLPETARSVVDFNEVTRRLKLTENLGILVYSKQTEQSRKFIVDLAARLSKAPKTVIADVTYRMDEVIQFFEKRGALYLDTQDLRKIRDFIQDSVAYETAIRNPLTIFESHEIPEPFLDADSLQKKYEEKFDSVASFPDGFYSTKDQNIRAMLVYLPSSPSKINASYALKEEVNRAIQELNPKSYASDIKINFTGTVQSLIEEQDSCMSDLGISTVVVIFLVSVAMILFYKTWAGTLALMASLLVGTAWTFGICYFLVHSLNSNSAFMGSIIIGNGINFGIILLARYLEERRAGLHNKDAIIIASSESARATWVAALAAGLAYGSLMATDFRGFNQFGVIGLVGMVLCWLSTFLLLPAFLTGLDRRGLMIIPKLENSKHSLSHRLANGVAKHPRAILAATAFLTLLSLAGLKNLSPDLIEADLNKLRDINSLKTGAGYYETVMNDIFKRDLAPLVILPRTVDEAETIRNNLNQALATGEFKGQINAVHTLKSSLPEDQKVKLQLIRDIRAEITPDILSHLSAEEKKKADYFLTPLVSRELTLKDLPPFLLNQFSENDGSTGKLVYVESVIRKTPWNIHELGQFVTRVREIADQVSPKAPVAGDLTVTADLVTSILKDGPKATVIAFFAVVLMVIFLFRKPSTVILILSGLCLGVGWMAGCILWFDLKINLLNFIALPITFGIGVDYSVNILQRYRQSKVPDITQTLIETGGAVALASFTTIVGYGSLLLAGNQAFVSFGRLAVIGEVTCLTTALLSVPALLCWLENKRERKSL